MLESPECSALMYFLACVVICPCYPLLLWDMVIHKAANHLKLYSSFLLESNSGRYITTHWIQGGWFGPICDLSGGKHGGNVFVHLSHSNMPITASWCTRDEQGAGRKKKMERNKLMTAISREASPAQSPTERCWAAPSAQGHRPRAHPSSGCLNFAPPARNGEKAVLENTAALSAGGCSACMLARALCPDLKGRFQAR